MTFNLLPVALNATAILGCNKQFQFLRFIKSDIDDMGRDIPQFEDPVLLTGSVQPLSNRMYVQLGLDFNRNYKTVFCPALIQSITEKLQPDRIVYDNRTYEVVEDKNLYQTNGWTKVLVVELKELREDDAEND